MAADRAIATGADTQGDLRKRNVAAGQNGNYLRQEIDEKLDEKTKQKVCEWDVDTASTSVRY
jgi:dolichyl-phosphate-mannose-protein mannosyltransferase